MEVKAGYKKTELGVIPEEWDVVALGALATIERGKFSARPRNDPKYYGGETPFLQTGDITRSGGKVTTFSQTLNKEGVKVSRVFPHGTLFFTIAANIGDVGIADFAAACPDSLVAFSPHAGTEKKWLLYELFRHKESFEALASPGAQLNINLEKLRPYQVRVPTHAEQRAIANALSDIDALIKALDRLIAKKRDIKQATMQQLLTGKTRLPGFSGKRVHAKLETLISRFSTGLNPRQNFRLNNGGNLHYVTIKNFSTGQLFLDEKCDMICEEAFMKINERSDLRKDDILFSSIGRIGDAYIITETPKKWNINESVFTLRPDRNHVVPLMLFYLLTDKIVTDALSQGATGSTFKSIKQAHLKAITCQLPTSLDEQAAIATVLSDIDSELSALEARRDKTRALKQGMMQELLTGKTRLI